MSFDGAQRQNCHRSRAIEVAHLFPRHLGKSLDRHGGDYTAATSSATTLSLAVVEELELAAEDVVTVGDWIGDLNLQQVLARRKVRRQRHRAAEHSLGVGAASA